MIEVKGTRTARPAVDAADPLGFRKPAEVGSGALVGFVGGLLGLAAYLRSFLWLEPAAALAEVPRQGPAPEDEGSRAAPQTHTLAAVAAAASAGRSKPAKTDDQDDMTMTLPVVFGPFDVGIFAPAIGPLQAGMPQGQPANSGLPPFGRIRSPDDAAGLPGAGVAGPAADPVGEVAVETPAAPGGTGPQPGGGPAPVRNRAPQSTGPVYLGEVGSGAVLAIAMSSLVANSSDADGDPLRVAGASSSSGSLQPRPGGLRFIADTEDLGLVQISYQVTDGRAVAPQTAFVTVVENRFDGTTRADLLLGTEGRDRITAYAGDDNIATFGGRDVVYGGLGDDNISGGAGRDTLYGDEGNDLISGGAGADWIYGGEGNDRLYGEDGDDHLQGDAGNDLLYGGSGKDTLLGDAGDDTLSGGDGDDVVAGGLGNDALSGDAGSDVLFGDDGSDTILGGAGEDILFGGLAADLLNGGADNDVLSGDAGNDTLEGDAGADLVSGGDGDDAIYGGAGNDVLLGGAGNDTLAGQDGADVLEGGDGNDVFHAVADGMVDTFDGNAGIDELSYAAEVADLTIDLTLGLVFVAAAEEDRFSNIKIFSGGSGDDSFIAAEGSATLAGNGGADSYSFVQGDTLERLPSVFRITDFGTDDRVSMIGTGSAYLIRRDQRELEDRIENLFEDFADRLTIDEPKFRYFHDWSEDYRRTVVEVDFDRDDSVDLTLTLDGEFMLEFLRQQA